MGLKSRRPNPANAKSAGRPAPPGAAARRIAVHVVRQVIEHGRTLALALASAFAEADRAGIEPRDRAFARAIIMATLRRYGEIDARISACLERPLPLDRGGHQAILATAIAQLLFLKSAPHAVINVAVDLTRADPKARRYDKLTNAVLRRIAREAEQAPAPDELTDDGVRANIPDWLWHRWSSTYGEATALDIARASLVEPDLDLSVRSDPAAFAERLGGIVLPTGSVRLRHEGRIEAIPGFEAGDWWVQDAAATLPAQLLGDVSGLAIADLCAAPGGKSAMLAARGATVTAVDLPGERADLLADTVRRLQLDVSIVASDVLAWTPDRTFDAVLVDAPCSATGTIRRHPDILRIHRKADLGPLIDLQARLLERAAGLVRVGGRLIYCTCSLEWDEGEAQIEAFLDAHPAFRIVPVAAGEIGGEARWITERGFVRTLPHQLGVPAPFASGIDGFFAARLERREAPG